MLITTIRQSAIKMNVTTRLDSQSSELGLLVRSQLGGLETVSVSDIEAGDGACLTASTVRVGRRAGFALDMPSLALQKDSPQIVNDSFSAITGNSARTISFWLLIAPGMTGRQALLGWGDNATEAAYFGIAYDAHRLAVGLGDNLEIRSDNLSIADGQWHHVGISYDGVIDEDNFRLLIDGTPEAFDVADSVISLMTDGNEDNLSGLKIGGTTDRRPFYGAISDIRLFDTALSADALSRLARYPHEDIEAAHLILHYQLDTSPSADDDPEDEIADLSGEGWHGEILEPADYRLFSASEHSYLTKQIGLYQQTDDSRYAAYLISRKTGAGTVPADSCPDSPPASAQKLGEAIFTRTDSGFFTSLDNSSSVILGAGLSSTADRDYGQNITSRHLALSDAVSRKDRCRIAPDFRFTDSAALSCMASTAYIHIIPDYDYGTGLAASEDRLVIPQAEMVATDTMLSFSGLPFDKGAGLSASYFPHSQLMMIEAENHALSGAEWQQIMRAVSFDTDAQESELAREFIFSIGAPAYLHEDGQMRYLRFVSEPDSISFSDAEIAASMTSLCGMTGYLATLTSHAEMTAFAYHSRPLPDNMTRLQRGWIGGSDEATEGVWRWLGGPEQDLAFWSGTGADGQPYNEDDLALGVEQTQIIDIGFADDMGIDVLHHPNLNYHQLENQNQSARFTAWAIGADNISFPDDSAETADYLMMSIDSQFRSLWANRRDDAACHDIMPDASFAPCGYFIEWGGLSQNQPELAETRTISLDDWAQICF